MKARKLWVNGVSGPVQVACIRSLMGLAVTVAPYNNGHTVTHLNSGRSLNSRALPLPLAVALLVKLTALADWASLSFHDVQAMKEENPQQFARVLEVLREAYAQTEAPRAEVAS